MSEPLFIAVDLGAGSGRVFLANVGRDSLDLEEIRRFYYPPRQKNGNLRWNFWLIFDEIIAGLKQAACRANEIGRSIQSLGIDSWAVDYGLLNCNGELIDDPVCYRDGRTSRAIDEVAALMSRHLIFEKTGIQFQNFNTLFQLWTEDDALETASAVLLLPDLINYFLTGTIAAEFTNATTTQMVNAESRIWDVELLDQLNLPTRVLPKIIHSGSDLGNLKADIAADVGLQDTRVVTPATHDTASAVAAASLSSEWAYISSGTWSLIGVELNEPLINEAVERQNFTNEGGVFGTTRFLKNVMGLWIFESCRREWSERGIDLDHENIIDEVSARSEFLALIFPDDERFLNPVSMLRAIEIQMQETGQSFVDDPIAISKIIFDSLAFRYASVLRSIESLTGRDLKGVHVLGGGGRNRYLDQMTANASGLRTSAGLYEATVVGNVMIQAISAGRFPSLLDARRYVERNVDFVQYIPNVSREIENASARYAEIEHRFTNERSAGL